MKSILEYLNECKDMAANNQLCYSNSLLMNGPKEGFEKEYAEAVRDGQIVDELIAMVKEKEAPAKQTPPCKCPLHGEDVQNLKRFFREIENYVQANADQIGYTPDETHNPYKPWPKGNERLIHAVPKHYDPYAERYVLLVTARGIECKGKVYCSPELLGWIGHRVFIEFDNTGRATALTKSGCKIGELTCQSE